MVIETSEVFKTSEVWKKKKVLRAIRPKKDRVRFYYVCAECLKRVEVTSGKDVLTDDPAPILVG